MYAIIPLPHKLNIISGKHFYFAKKCILCFAFFEISKTICVVTNMSYAFFGASTSVGALF